MKWNSRRVSAWAYAAPADLRKGFDGLSALVMNELGRDPLSGELYLFVSRNRIRAKVLHWDGTGLCVYAKRLEEGKFACLWSSGDGEPVRLAHPWRPSMSNFVIVERRRTSSIWQKP